MPKIECLSLLGWFEKGHDEVLVPQWKEHLGVDVGYVVVDSREARKRADEGSPFFIFDFWMAEYLDPDCLLRYGFPWELTGYKGGSYRDLVERAGRTMDQAERIELYARADRILIEDAVVAPAEYGGAWWLVKPWVTRFPCATALKEMFWKDIVLEPH